MKKTLPVFNIGHFDPVHSTPDFYAENIHTHVQTHHFTGHPHKHDFFLIVLFTGGSGTHEVDFTRYKIVPGSLFLLSPGQSHHWQLSAEIEGTIFFHSREFFDKGFSSLQLNDFPFFGSLYNPPLLRLKKGQVPAINALFSAILGEQKKEQAMKYQKLLSLVSGLYIEVARLYQPGAPVKSEQYLPKLRQFELLLDKHFKEIKFPSEYAHLMSITERHLNRISKTALNKTPSELILNRNMLEAKRMLMHNKLRISEVAAQLGYPDHSYFARLFKKQTGKTPREFIAGYK